MAGWGLVILRQNRSMELDPTDLESVVVRVWPDSDLAGEPQVYARSDNGTWVHGWKLAVRMVKEACQCMGATMPIHGRRSN